MISKVILLCFTMLMYGLICIGMVRAILRYHRWLDVNTKRHYEKFLFYCCTKKGFFISVMIHVTYLIIAIILIQFVHNLSLWILHTIT